VSDTTGTTRGARSTSRRAAVVALVATVSAGCLSGLQQSERQRELAAQNSTTPLPVKKSQEASPNTGRQRGQGPQRAQGRDHSPGGRPAGGAPRVGRFAVGSRPAEGQPDEHGTPDDIARLGGWHGRQPYPVDCTKRKCIALTFDDGPGPYTGQLLDTLAARGVRATFFVLGENATHSPELVRRIGQEGHELANHGYDHSDLSGLSTVEAASQLARTQRAVYAASGIWPRLMRPPYGATDAGVDKVTRRLGLPQILWTVDTMDWQMQESASVIKHATGRPRHGGIVLLHDIHKSSVEAVPRIIDRLHRKGFNIVTVSELYSHHPFTPGKSYLGAVP
jgi:peptidoglycan/xylan/chitin deacetylase (PgdA/CDA1 family)